MAEIAAGTSRRHPLVAIAFVVLMVALTALFVVLGTWQLNRLHEKEATIAAIAARSALAPVPLPPAAEWPALDVAAYDYRPVSVTGIYRAEDTVLVFASLGAPKGRYSGAGYWVMTPLQVADGGLVYINRGFVPQAQGPQFLVPATVPSGEITLAGLARHPEAANGFTPAADAQNRIEWIRDPARLALLAGDTAAPVAPLFVDAPAGEVGALPQGGETVLKISNRHMEYVVTWYGLALVTPVLLIYWLVRQRRGRN